MGKGEENEGFGGGRRVNFVCWSPAGLCLHRAVSPGELPDVIFLGQVGTAVGAELWEEAQQRGLQGSCGAEDLGDVQP